ncbi:MAG: hypothetical protein H6807_03365 [Planctomycetes bacterium]|nr:hypothetical protein [Planctomycetota bacterium]
MRRLHAASILALLILAGASPAQALFTSTRGQATAGPESDRSFDGAEILAFAPGAGEIRHHRNHGALHALLGDADGNGIHDDFGGMIDALCPPPAGVDGGILGFLFSVDRSVPTLSGTIEDGDIVVLMPGGLVTEIIDESVFAVMTGTSTIDVDAFHMADDGSICFSFADDETTSSAALAAANGGDPLLDESTVFVLPPGAPEALILFSRGQIIAMVNQAMGSNLSSVVDVTGISPDPGNPGEWLFTTGSTNASIEGRVFSSAGGGSLAQLGGSPLDSTAFGFVDEEVLEALAVADLLEVPLTLVGPDLAQAAPGFSAWEVAGATPFGRVHLIASHSLFPAPPGEPYPALLGFPWLVVNSSDPFLYASIQSLSFSDYADFDGRARVVFDVSGLISGLRMTMQAVDLVSLRASPPVTAWL